MHSALLFAVPTCCVVCRSEQHAINVHILHSILNLMLVSNGSLVDKRITNNCVQWPSVYPAILMLALDCTKVCSLQNCFSKVASITSRGVWALLVLLLCIWKSCQVLKMLLTSHSPKWKQLPSKSKAIIMGSMLTYVWTCSQAVDLSLVSFSQEVAAARVLSLGNMHSLHTAVKLQWMHVWAILVHVSRNPCMKSAYWTLWHNNTCWKTDTVVTALDAGLNAESRDERSHRLKRV